MSGIIRLVLAYDGTDYHGWQVQPEHPTIQGVVEQALQQLYGVKISCQGAGRTDAGAHALGYSAHFFDPTGNISPAALVRAMNSSLPAAVRVLDAMRAPGDFHARFSAQAREYLYHLIPGRIAQPHWRNYAYYYPYALDLDAVREILKVFQGEHDFRSYCYGYGSQTPDTVRRIYYFRLSLFHSHLVFSIKGSGFLQGMIRSLLAVVLNYQQGRVSREQILASLQSAAAIESRYRVPVPARGLFFKRAYYPIDQDRE